MPQHFRFERTDPYVTEHLDANTINRITTWQDPTSTYQFSFHTQHEAGWPCYIVETNGPDRNLPKINLKEPTTPPTVLEGGNIRDNKAGKDFKAVITANISHFQTLAKAYYVVDIPVVTPKTRAFRFKCTKKAPPFTAKMPSRVTNGMEMVWWSNAKSRLLPQVTCAQHRNALCMETTPTVVELTAEEARKVLVTFD